MGGKKTVYWMIDPRWKTRTPPPNTQVGWSTTIIGGAGTENTWSMVEVWASDNKTIWVDRDGIEYKRMYKIQDMDARAEILKANL